MALFRPHKNHKDAIPLLIVVIVVIVLLVIVIIYIRKRRERNGRSRDSRSVDSRLSRGGERKDHRWNGEWKGIFDSRSRSSNDSGDRFSRHLAEAEFMGDELREWIGKGPGSLSRPYYVNADRYAVKSSSNSMSAVCPSDQPQNCPKCKDGGLGARCNIDTDCACGLKCEGRECVCPKPAPPTLHIQKTGNSITVTFSPVPGADYYNIFLFDDFGVAHAIIMFTDQTVLTFPDLPMGSYHVFAFSGSDECGTLQQFSQSDIISIAPCSTNRDCVNPTSPICRLGDCVQCLTANDCPSGKTCNLSNNTCVPTCTLDTDCLTPDTVCSNGQCICPTPTITGMSIVNANSASWPSPMQFVFQGTGFSPSGATFSFDWRGVGSDGQIATSGSVSSTFLSLDRFPQSPYSVFPGNTTCNTYPCCNQFNFGCTASGCTSNPSPNVVLEFLNVVVTNGCGNASAPTCWRFTSLCPGGPITAVQFTCPTRG